MEIRQRGLVVMHDSVLVTADSYIDWINILVKEQVITEAAATRILTVVQEAIDIEEGNLQLLDVRVLHCNAVEPGTYVYGVYESLNQRFADDVKHPYYTSFYVVA